MIVYFIDPIWHSKPMSANKIIMVAKSQIIKNNVKA